MGFCYLGEKFKCWLLKPTSCMYYIYIFIYYSMFLIDTINLEIQNLCYIFTRVFRGRESGAYKIKPFFHFVLGLLSATITLFKRNEKTLKVCHLKARQMMIFSVYRIHKICFIKTTSEVLLFRSLMRKFRI